MLFPAYPGLGAKVGGAGPEAGIRVQAESSGFETLGGDVTGPAAGRVKEVGEVGRVVLGQKDWLEGGKVGEQDPAPGGDHQVLQLDVPVTHGQAVRLN